MLLDIVKEELKIVEERAIEFGKHEIAELIGALAGTVKKLVEHIEGPVAPSSDVAKKK